MRYLIRMFFRALRIILGPFMLLWEFLTRPEGIVRPLEQQDEVDQECQSLTLYQFRTCPFCIKVRREVRRLSLDIKSIDAQHDEHVRNELLSGGGEIKVPCLRITDDSGNFQWLYESGKIIEYLHKRFSTTARSSACLDSPRPS